MWLMPRPETSATGCLRWETILVVLLVIVIAGNTAISPYFLDIYNLSDATYNFSEKAIVALAMALLIIVREIDLSVAAIIALASLAIGLAAQAGAGLPVLLLIGPVVGAACGAFNGFLVTRIALPSIVVTIGTMSLFRGLAQVVLGDQAITQYPKNLTAIGQSYLIKWPPLPYSFVIFLVFAVVFAIVLHKTALGRKLYAIGNNPVAARFSGIPVERIRFMLFVLTGTTGRPRRRASDGAHRFYATQYCPGLGTGNHHRGDPWRRFHCRWFGHHSRVWSSPCSFWALPLLGYLWSMCRAL